jgi:hypothetical protein
VTVVVSTGEKQQFVWGPVVANFDSSVVIVDPSLVSDSGHMLAQATSLAASLKRFEFKPQIIANLKFVKPPGVAIDELEPFFRRTPYHMPSRDPVLWRLESRTATLTQLVDDLQSLLSRYRGTKTTFIFPTVNFIMIDALATVRDLIGDNWPTELSLIVFLYLECGVYLDNAGNPLINDTLLAAIVKPALVRLASHTCVNVLGVSKEMATIYGYLAERSLGTVMSFHDLPGIVAAREVISKSKLGRTRVLLYGGQASNNKGFARVSAVLKYLLQSDTKTEYVVQLHKLNGQDQQIVGDEVRALSQKHPNVKVIEGLLSDSELALLLVSCAVVLVGYDRNAYGGKTSGFLWDAVRVGARIVLPSATWLSREAEFFGAAVFQYEGESPATVAAAVKAAVASKNDEARRRTASSKFEAVCGPDSLVKGLIERGMLSPARAAGVEGSTTEAGVAGASRPRLSSVDPSRWLKS